MILITYRFVGSHSHHGCSGQPVRDLIFLCLLEPNMLALVILAQEVRDLDILLLIGD